MAAGHSTDTSKMRIYHKPVRKNVEILTSTKIKNVTDEFKYIAYYNLAKYINVAVAYQSHTQTIRNIDIKI